MWRLNHRQQCTKRHGRKQQHAETPHISKTSEGASVHAPSPQVDMCYLYLFFLFAGIASDVLHGQKSSPLPSIVHINPNP